MCIACCRGIICFSIPFLLGLVSIEPQHLRTLYALAVSRFAQIGYLYISLFGLSVSYHARCTKYGMSPAPALDKKRTAQGGSKAYLLLDFFFFCFSCSIRFSSFACSIQALNSQSITVLYSVAHVVISSFILLYSLIVNVLQAVFLGM